MIDLQTVPYAIGIVMGHNQNVCISGITFKNLNTGHFIEMDAAKEVAVTNCSFLDSIESPKHNKEAINIDTPDPLTNGFNNIWSAQDKTPDQDVTIDNCTFKNLDCAIGTHSYSQVQDANGKYIANIYHSGIRITNSKFYNIRNYVFDIINWRNVVITNCDISGGSYTTQKAPYVSYSKVVRLKGIEYFTFKNNNCKDVGSIAYTTYTAPASNSYKALYTDLEFHLSVANMKDLIFNNNYSNVKNYLIDICPLKKGSFTEDLTYSNFIKYSSVNTANDRISLYVGLNYKTLSQVKAEASKLSN